MLLSQKINPRKTEITYTEKKTERKRLHQVSVKASKRFPVNGNMHM